MTYAIGIVAHPARAGQAIQLRKQVHADVISFDHAGIGGKANHLRVLTMLTGSGKDWLVILEDDATPCHNFNALLEHALDNAGDTLVSLYLGTGAWAGANQTDTARLIPQLIATADATHAEWINAPGLFHAVAIAIPAHRAPAALNYLHNSPHAIDKALSRWAAIQRIPVRYTWPSLVDHADGDRLIGEPHAFERKAWRTHPMSI